MKREYLMITMHDNDFSISLELLGETLLNIFSLHEYPNNQRDLDRIKEYVQYMIWGIHNISHAFLGKHSWTTPLSVFDCDLSIIDEHDIPEWDNAESIYVPLFEFEGEEARVLLR